MCPGFLRHGEILKPRTRTEAMATPAICSTVPLTSGCGITRTRTAHPVPALGMDQDDRAAREAPAMAADCSICTARSTCLITPCLDGAISPDSSFLKRQLFARGEHIYREGDAPARVYVVQSGMVKSYMTSMNGNEHVITFDMQGNLLGLDGLTGEVHTSSAVALETVSLCGISIGRMETLGNRFPLWQFNLLASELVRGHSTLLILGRKDAQARLAAFLLDLSGRFRVRGQSPQEFNLSMSRQDIGNHLGMTIETVCRALTYLRKTRLIDIDYRRVLIRDFDRLRALAGTRHVPRC